MPKIKTIEEGHPDHGEVLNRFKRIRGQIEGVERMIQGGRYCVDIMTQLKAVSASIESAKNLIFEKHLRHCVHDAINTNNEKNAEQKINEILTLLGKK